MIGNEISFAGLLQTEKGVKTDPARMVALTDFPVPKDVPGVPSFLGLANQLSRFVSDFLAAKKNTFLWLQDHQEEFEKIKRLLTSDMVVMHFDPNLSVAILTDASRLHGLEYAKGQFADGKSRVVACGSKSLTPTQHCYATIKCECLGVHFAVDKCSLYLKGAPLFNVVMDHKPLELMFGRSQNTLLPQPANVFAPIDLQVAAAAKDKANNKGNKQETTNKSHERSPLCLHFFKLVYFRPWHCPRSKNATIGTSRLLCPIVDSAPAPVVNFLFALNVYTFLKFHISGPGTALDPGLAPIDIEDLITPSPTPFTPCPV